MELWVNEFWIFFAYATGTVAGIMLNFRSLVKNSTTAVIDKLIEEGYLKTRGSGKDMEILKYTEWNND